MKLKPTRCRVCNINTSDFVFICEVYKIKGWLRVQLDPDNVFYNVCPRHFDQVKKDAIEEYDRKRYESSFI